MENSNDGVLVAGFWIPTSEVNEYIEAREKCDEAAISVMEQFCDQVERCWADSEDGEAVAGLNEDGEIVCLVYLNPEEVSKMMKAISADSLANYITGTL